MQFKAIRKMLKAEGFKETPYCESITNYANGKYFYILRNWREEVEMFEIRFLPDEKRFLGRNLSTRNIKRHDERRLRREDIQLLIDNFENTEFRSVELSSGELRERKEKVKRLRDGELRNTEKLLHEQGEERKAFGPRRKPKPRGGHSWGSGHESG